MRIITALVFLLVGLGFTLLLNGQTFTNSLVGIALASAAIAIAFGPARDDSAPRARLWKARILVGLGVLLAVALLTQLRSAYRFQSGFNRRVVRIRRGAP
jgi:hypothetical protein